MGSIVGRMYSSWGVEASLICRHAVLNIDAESPSLIVAPTTQDFLGRLAKQDCLIWLVPMCCVYVEATHMFELRGVGTLDICQRLIRFKHTAGNKAVQLE